MGARRKVTRKRYMDADRAFALRALAARDGNVSRTARELGIPVSSLHQWARGKRYAGRIDRSPDGPLDFLWHFRRRALPVLCMGETIAVDLTKLDQKQHAQLARLLKIARANQQE